MKGTPGNTVILHWDECRTSWAELSWHDWVRFIPDRGEGVMAGGEPARIFRATTPRPGVLVGQCVP
jgi:hypothetical protein